MLFGIEVIGIECPHMRMSKAPPVLRPGHLSPTGAEHLQDFVHGDGPVRSIGQQLPPIAVQAPLYSVPDEGLGLEHVRRAYSPQLNLRRQAGTQ
jgi:hypothetical protein